MELEAYSILILFLITFHYIKLLSYLNALNWASLIILASKWFQK